MSSLMGEVMSTNSIGAVTNTGSTLEVNVYPRGLPGYVYLPSVDNDGNITWTNKGGLTNPETKNIRGIHYTPSIDLSTGILNWTATKGDAESTAEERAIIYTYVPVINNGVLNWELRQGGISPAEIKTKSIPSSGIDLREMNRLKFSELNIDEKNQIKGDKGEKGDSFSVIGVYNSSNDLEDDPIAASAEPGSWALIQGILSEGTLSTAEMNEIKNYVDTVVTREVTNKLNQSY